MERLLDYRVLAGQSLMFCIGNFLRIHKTFGYLQNAFINFKRTNIFRFTLKFIDRYRAIFFNIVFLFTIFKVESRFISVVDGDKQIIL